METTDFKLPDVGEGLTEADVLTWLVAVGDTVEVNDLLVEVETAKAVVELPAPVAGTILAIYVDAGATVAVGTVLVSIGDPTSAIVDVVGPPAPSEAHQVDREPTDESEEQPLVLVGTGPTAAAERTRRLGRRPSTTAPDAAVPTRPRATPPVRALARQLGVDLAELDTEPGDVISRDDVLAAAGPAETDARVAPPAATAHLDIDLEPDQEVTRTPIKGVRKVTATAMTRSAFTAPHVTEWLSVDVTPTMELIASLKADRAWQGVRVNPMLMVARALLLAVRRHPAINASWDDEAQEICQFRHVNLGIAAATPRGLIVPNVKHADALDLRGLAGALSELVETARSGRTKPAAMSGGTITLTNIGALGVDAGTPILNPGEAAILAMGMVRPMPWVVNGEIVVRQVTQLALSFDHRLVDGELGSHVLAEVGALLASPARAIAYV